MKNLFILIISVISFAILSPAMAAGPQADSNSELDSSIVTEMQEWGNLGKGVTEALVSAAKEAGMALNVFLNTDTGKIVSNVIIYKVIGRDVLGYVYGVVVILMGLTLIITAVRSSALKGSVTFELVPILWGAFYVKKTKVASDSLKGQASHIFVNKFIFSILILIISMWVGLCCIF